MHTTTYVMASTMFNPMCLPYPCCSIHSLFTGPYRIRYPIFSAQTKLMCNASLPTSRSKNICAAARINAPVDPLVTETRRSANYQPCVWSYEFLQSLNSNDVEVETYRGRAAKLEEEHRQMFDRVDAEPERVIEFMDDIQRLGLGSVYKNETMEALDKIASSKTVKAKIKKNLHATALSFRLLRQHGFEVSRDVFRNFQDSKGNFKSEINNDLKGMLGLYEASYLAFEEDELLVEANNLTTTHLKTIECLHATKRPQISHALELPYYRRVTKLEARWHIETYGKIPDANRSLLELAKLNFNLVQSVYYQRELKAVVRWWKEMGLANKLTFARDRSTECYIWALGMASEPQFSHCREELAKVAAFITTIDDVYDVYGTLNELELFTESVQRWDVHAVDKLPDYMKLCFLALYNTINEIAYKIMKQQGVHCLPHLTKAWADTCNAFLEEAKWSHNKVTPTFNDYLQNGWVSVSGSLLLSHAMFLIGQDFTKQSIDSLYNNHDLLRLPSTILRLCNDLATSADEVGWGETTNSITCYMNDTGESDAQSRSYLRAEIDKSWKKMNKEIVKGTTFSKAFAEAAIDLARISHCTYQYGDGHGRPDGRSRNRVKQLILEPIPFPNELSLV